jgi:nucleoside-triphosphatase
MIMGLLLTGAPGVGKTTIVRKVGERLSDLRLAGFYTAEIRARGERRGFRLVTFAGEQQTIAHVDIRGPRVSKYGVDVSGIDRFALAILDSDRRVDVYLVDEIGKMECLSARFVEAMRRLFDGGWPLVATVGQRGTGFIAEVKQRRDVELWTVTRTNRDALPDQVVAWVRDATGMS